MINTISTRLSNRLSPKHIIITAAILAVSVFGVIMLAQSVQAASKLVYSHSKFNILLCKKDGGVRMIVKNTSSTYLAKVSIAAASTGKGMYVDKINAGQTRAPYGPYIMSDGKYYVSYNTSSNYYPNVGSFTLQKSSLPSCS
jgi:hypothetical protein